MKRLLLALAIATLGALPAHAQFLGKASGGGGGFTPSCSQSGTFLARWTSPDATDQSTIDAVICGLVTDNIITGNLTSTGCGSLLDFLYLHATHSANAANAVLNVCGTSYTAIANGSPALTVDGYLGVDGSST